MAAVLFLWDTNMAEVMSCQKALKTGVAFGFAFSRLRNISGVHTFLSIIVTTPSLFQVAKVKISKNFSISFSRPVPGVHSLLASSLLMVCEVSHE